MANSVDEPFNFIDSSRVGNEIRDNYTDYLASFIRLGKEFLLPYKSITLYIASAILINIYSPRIYSTSLVFYLREFTNLNSV